MLQNASKAAHAVERVREAPTIISNRSAVSNFIQTREGAPHRARWMRDDGVRPVVMARLPRDVPRIDTFHACIDALCIDVERGDHRDQNHSVTEPSLNQTLRTSFVMPSKRASASVTASA